MSKLSSVEHRCKKIFTFFIIFIKNASFNVSYFLVENFFILLNPLKSY